MPARTGQDYINGLREQPPRGSGCEASGVTRTSPRIRRCVAVCKAVAALYDLQSSA